MVDKKVKIINSINIMLSILVLILESLPNSIIKVTQIDGGFITAFHSYFSHPSKWNVKLLIAFIVAMFSIVNLILDIFLLLKNKKAIIVFSKIIKYISALLCAYMLFVNIFIQHTEFITPHNIIIMILFIIQIINISIVSYLDKKICVASKNR